MRRVLGHLWHRAGEAWRRIPIAGRWIAALAIANALAWMLIVPPGHIPDEDQQVAYAQYLAETGKLPHDAPGRSFSPEMDQTWGALRFYAQLGRSYEPALWAQSQEGSLRAVEHAKLARIDTGDAEAATNNPPMYYLLAAIPYHVASGGTFLDRVYAMRLLSVLLAGLTALCAFLFAREALPLHAWAWTLAGTAVALQPLFAFMSAGVHNDNLVNTFAAAELFVVARTMRLGLTQRRGTALGLLLAGGLLSKAAMAAFIPVVLWTLAVTGWRMRHRAGELVRAVAATIASAAVPVGTYFLLTATVWSRDIYPGGGVVSNVGATGAQFSWREYASFTWQLLLPRLPFQDDLIPGVPIRDTFLNGFVGRFGWLDYGFSARVDHDALLIFEAIGVLILVSLARHWRILWRRLPEIVAYVGSIVAVFAIVGLAAYRARLDGQNGFEQARYVLPLLGIYGLGLGVAALAAGRWARVIAVALIGLALAHDVFAQLITVQRFYT